MVVEMCYSDSIPLTNDIIILVTSGDGTRSQGQLVSEYADHHWDLGMAIKVKVHQAYKYI